MVAAFLEVVIALMPAKLRQKLFPPVVIGTAVMLIGASLITAGIKYVGGGVFCAENGHYRIRNAPVFTFLWAETFPLGFAPEYFFPILIGFFVSTAETIGDVTMSCKYSKLRDGRARESRKLTSRTAGCSQLASTRSCPPLFHESAHGVLQNNWVIALHAVRVAVRLRVRVLADIVRCVRETGRGVQHSYLCGRGRRAPSLQSPTVSVTSHVPPSVRGAQ